MIKHQTSIHAMCQIIDTMMLNQESDWVSDFKKQMSPSQFLHEFQTVQLHLPRRSGHSTVATYCYVRYNSIMLFPSMRFAADFVRNTINEPTKLIPSEFRCFVGGEDNHYGANFFKHALQGTDKFNDCELLTIDMASIHSTKDWIGEYIDIAFACVPSLKGLIVLQ